MTMAEPILVNATNKATIIAAADPCMNAPDITHVYCFEIVPALSVDNFSEANTDVQTITIIIAPTQRIVRLLSNAAMNALKRVVIATASEYLHHHPKVIFHT